MSRISSFARLVAATLVAAAAVGGTARAEDPLAGMTPLGSPVLIGNTANITGINNTATQTGNTINVKGGGQIVNGAIQNNSVANNSGVTAVLMNTGNNVNFNNAMVVNILVPH
ncbi:MAG TPA: hypothetical protein VFA50_04425 [Stellaceae bacterium]|nr:hypothetical protein [Stellaceae bacterium]